MLTDTVTALAAWCWDAGKELGGATVTASITAPCKINAECYICFLPFFFLYTQKSSLDVFQLTKTGTNVGLS